MGENSVICGRACLRADVQCHRFTSWPFDEAGSRVSLLLDRCRLGRVNTNS